ncbi:3'-5' exonuclease [Acinetobacter baumannii]|uniref:3'-5' exonuclease n=1 Tax=Acinetobacter baumannii TaxID=470 RepID=UPI0024B6694D|nr:3'-5' exonuclease [Acinetobacter baumannii]MDI9761126.1 3'-5' exonuclease [Acinetobacter baumannii]
MQTHAAVILKTETDSLEGRAIEIAFHSLDLTSGCFSFQRKDMFNMRFNPERRISVEAMAKHNIINQDLKNKPSYRSFTLPASVLYIVGHNIDYDVRVLRRSGIKQDLKPIDTLAMAKTLLPNAPGYSLETLSYYLASDQMHLRDYLLNTKGTRKDVDLTAALLSKLIKLIPQVNKGSFQDLYEFSLECRVPKVIPAGEYQGRAIADLPDSYKQFLLKSPGTDLWLKFALELDAANANRRTFEALNSCIPNTYEDHQFINSRTPVKISKLHAYESLVIHATKA